MFWLNLIESYLFLSFLIWVWFTSAPLLLYIFPFKWQLVPSIECHMHFLHVSPRRARFSINLTPCLHFEDFWRALPHGQGHLEVSKDVTRSEARFHSVFASMFIESKLDEIHGKNMKFMEKNMKIMEKHENHEKNMKFMEKNMKFMKKTWNSWKKHEIHGKRHEIHGNTTWNSWKNNMKIMEKQHELHEKNHEIHEKNHEIHEKNHEIHEKIMKFMNKSWNSWKKHEIHEKNHEIHGKNMKFRNNHGAPIVTIEWKVPVLLACAWLSFTLIFIL